jgi:hypothetical protein
MRLELTLLGVLISKGNVDSYQLSCAQSLSFVEFIIVFLIWDCMLTGKGLRCSKWLRPLRHTGRTVGAVSTEEVRQLFLLAKICELSRILIWRRLLLRLHVNNTCLV